ncbi:efflux RND transporter periplasmic adaptor subunit [Pseudomonas sp. CGJS7]|uniref:efflux RND transporter periplasmic adaptor subunit n=1 Tax=Pseudomonas sp. CGJS7 TaxID=3109348 RepID=UPI0030096E35
MSAEPSFRTREILIAAATCSAIVGVLLWWRWHGAGADKGAAEADAEPAVPVRVATAQREDFALTLKALGTVTPLSHVTLRSRVEGELVEVAFKEGQQVEAGQLLARIDPRTYQVQLAKAQGQQQENLAALDNARHELARYRELKAGHYVSAQDVSNREAQVRQLEGRRQSDQAAVDEARVLLGHTRIVAPVSGRMGLRGIDAGNLVSAGNGEGAAIASIAQTSPISVLFTVAENELPGLLDAVQRQPELGVEAWDREERKRLGHGRLASLDNRIDSATGTLRIRAVFDNADAALFPQQFVNVRLSVGRSDTVVIPDAAVQFGAKGNYVFVVGADSKVAIRPLKLGPAQDGRIAVLEGLKPNERVVLEGLDRLRDGSAVEVIADKIASEATATAQAAGSR